MISQLDRCFNYKIIITMSRMNVSTGPTTHTHTHKKTASFDIHHFILERAEERVWNRAPQQQLIYCILRCCLNLLTPVCFRIWGEVLRRAPLKEGGKISIMFREKKKKKKAATGAFQCTKLPCDMMNGQPLMLWGIKDNFWTISGPTYRQLLFHRHNKFSAATGLITSF